MTLIATIGAIWAIATGAARSPAPPAVMLWRRPAAEIQPQAAVDSRGAVHVVFFRGGSTDGVGNLYYERLDPGENAPTVPMRVNSQPDSAGCVGTVRTAHIAIGRGGRVHVAWNGLGPKGPNGYPVAYQAYARLNDSGTAFEPQRDLATWARGLDGGGSVAADGDGNVYVVWHALAGASDEAGRAVFVARSTDDGRTFTREARANPEATGACGCCGLRALVDSSGALHILYRAAAERAHRDSTLLVSRDHGRTFTQAVLDRWRIDACPMSTYALAQSGLRLLAAWETAGHVRWTTVDSAGPRGATIDTPVGEDQKHPTITANARGDTLVAWTEGTGWQRGGSLAWQVYNAAGKPIGAEGRATGVPVWGLATAYAASDGHFVVVY